MAFSQAWADLLKLPLAVATVIVALAVAKSCNIVTFGPLTELGPAKFAEQSKATTNAVTDLDSSVSALAVRVKALEDRSAPPNAAAKNEVQSEAFAAAQTASDVVAQASRVAESIQPTNLKGYIWIGDYRQRWERPMLGALGTGLALEKAPTTITPGDQYKVLGNMVVRNGLPANDENYYRSRASLGVVSRGTTITVTQAPVGIDRGFAIQYWVEVSVQRSVQ